MKNKEKRCYIVLNTGMESKGLVFSGVYMKSGRKGWLEKERVNT